MKGWSDHIRQVERASFADVDGMLWFDDQVWRNGEAFRQIFWQFYAPRIAPHNHGRALRALARATKDGMVGATSQELRDMLKRTMEPFWETRRQRVRREQECPYCARPYEASKQCLGCGAWRRADA